MDATLIAGFLTNIFGADKPIARERERERKGTNLFMDQSFLSDARDDLDVVDDDDDDEDRKPSS